jgi:CheY-like chemotaxis protein
VVAASEEAEAAVSAAAAPVPAAMVPRPVTAVGAPVPPPMAASAAPHTRSGAVLESLEAAAEDDREPMDAFTSERVRGMRDDELGIEFLDHCRVDRESVRAACSDVARSAPELRWHTTIRRPMELALQSAVGLDDLVSSPWLRPQDDRGVDVPAFKQAFFDDLKRLGRAQEEAKQELSALWRYLGEVGADAAAREAAVGTFAGLASLRMMARLRRFEGKLRSGDGRTIVDLFPDLPPIRSPWLLRRVPYRSRVGGLALGAEQLLLCCVGPSMDSFHYFLLPRQIAEAAQGDREGFPRDVFSKWIVPQWFFQKYEGTPGARQIVWVLVDEYGRERRDASARAPWQKAMLIEEEPHPALTLGELQEIEPRWHVSTLPLEPEASPGGRRPMQPPLIGRSVLWVDDNPDNILFEVRYLEHLGATVAHAASTAQALAHISSHETDLVISDMSRIEDGKWRSHAGIELLERARAQQERGGRPIPIIYYVGNRMQVPAEHRSLAAGYERALFKLVLESLRS